MPTPKNRVRHVRPQRWRFRSVLAAALLTAGQVAAPLHAAQAAIALDKRPAAGPEELLLAVRVEREQLSSAVSALDVDGEVRLPLGEIARLLELDVTVEPARRRIVIGPDRVVPFDPAHMTATEDDV